MQIQGTDHLNPLNVIAQHIFQWQLQWSFIVSLMASSSKCGCGCDWPVGRSFGWNGDAMACVFIRSQMEQ